MRPTHWSSDDENVPITAANQKHLWAMTDVFILSMQLCGVVEVPRKSFQCETQNLTTMECEFHDKTTANVYRSF